MISISITTATDVSKDLDIPEVGDYIPAYTV